MDQADFVHMVRMSEIASAENSSAYRRSVAAFAALGYAWVLGCLVLALGMVAWAVPPLLAGRFKLVFVMVLISGLTLLWTSLQALWLRSDAPDGVEITAVEAPALFEALERIRRKIKGPHIHHVYLNDEFNACIRQQPRYGLLGGALTVRDADDRWRVSLFVRNLLDKNFVNRIFATPVLNSPATAPVGSYTQFPSADARRTVGVSASFRFGD